MSSFKFYFSYLCMIALVILLPDAGDLGSFAEPNFDEAVCNLLTRKLIASNPWTTYPIVHEPIKRGRLSIWTGVSSLPSSEFKCYTNKNSTNEILLDFANFANKLEWTFYDMSKGITHNGISVNYCEDIKFKVTLSNKQLESYRECNTIKNIEEPDLTRIIETFQSTCQDCNQLLITSIDSQIKELLRFKLRDQIKENLYWHITQLLSNQHFSGPVSYKDNFNRV